MTEEKFYWLDWTELDANGRFSIKLSIYDNDWHSTGFEHFSPGDPDYNFWIWIRKPENIAKVSSENHIINGEELSRLRVLFQSER